MNDFDFEDYLGPYVAVPQPIIEDLLRSFGGGETYAILKKCTTYEPDNHHNAKLCPYCKPKMVIVNNGPVPDWVTKRQHEHTWVEQPVSTVGANPVSLCTCGLYKTSLSDKPPFGPYETDGGIYLPDTGSNT